MTRAFTVVLERDPETDWLVGEVVELPGCYTQSPDMPTLETNIKEAIAAYLQTVGFRPASPRQPARGARGATPSAPGEFRCRGG